MRAEDDVDAIALVLRPARKPVLDARRERLDEPVRVVVARDVLEVDAPAVELEAVGDLLLVAGDGQRREVRREHEAHRVRHALLGHLADDLLDPRRPVAHAEVQRKSSPSSAWSASTCRRVTSRSGERPPIAR